MQKNGAKVCNTDTKQTKPFRIKNAKPFVKGDPRINRNGRPRTFDQARALAQAIAHEVERIDPGGDEVTVAEAVLRAWSQSKEPQLQKAFIEYAFGKVPDKIDATMEHRSKLYLNYSHEESDAREDRSRIPATVSSGTN